MSSAVRISKLFLKTTLFVLLLNGLNVYIYAQGSHVPNLRILQVLVNEPAIQPQPSVTEPPTEIGKTAEGLKWFFTVLVYPALVCGVFLLLLGSIFYVTTNAHGFGFVRRATGALLPFLLLTFMLLITDAGNDPVKEFFVNRGSLTYLIMGIVIGAALMEFGKYLMQTDDDRQGSIYNLFLSSMVVFLLYSIMKGFLDKLIYFLFAMIMAGGIDIVFAKPFESKLPPRRRSPSIPLEPKQTIGKTEKTTQSKTSPAEKINLGRGPESRGTRISEENEG